MARHSTLVGADAIHQASYYQSADPGAVGAGKDWWDTTASPPTLKRRNDANSAWVAVSTPSSGSPTGAAGGVLSGTYPNPGFAVDMATQAELDAVAALKANLASPAFTGNPIAPTATTGDNTTSIATTQFVTTAVAAGKGSKFTIGVQLGNGVDAITTAEPEYILWVDSGSFNITGWTISGDVTGSIVAKVETSPYSGFPTLTEVMPSERPTLSSARTATTTLGAAVAITTKIAIRITVVSASTVKAVSIGFSCTRV